MSPPLDDQGRDRSDAAVLRLVERLQRALRGEERALIVEAVRGLVEMRANMGGQWQGLAHLAAENGEPRLAREAIGLYVESAGGSPVARYNQAGLLAHLGAWEEAQTVLMGLPADLPDPAANAHSRGTAALYLGESDVARAELERATQLQPRSGAAWLSLATAVDFAQAPELAERAEANQHLMAGAPPRERGLFSYALGKAHADRGEYAAAFAAFAAGARDLKSGSAYSRERDRLVAAEATEGYTAETIAAIAAQQSEPSGRTIFVTGLPRSGTTLVEQILTSHSAVSDGAEINRLGLLVKDIHGVSHAALSAHVARVGAPAFGRLWNHWIGERFPAPGRVVDKTVNTGRMLGLAASLLPDAPLVWLKRDPLDCAWSCFRTCFTSSVPWSYDLEDIAYHFRLEDALLARWQEILGERLLVLPYEELVTAPEPSIRRLLAHCGLAEEPQVFAPHENRRVVGTSSVMQVRRPINRAAIGAAEPYREFLRPFIDAYYG